MKPHLQMPSEVSASIDPENPEIGQVVFVAHDEDWIFQLDREALRTLGRRIEQALASSRPSTRKKAETSGNP